MTVFTVAWCHALMLYRLTFKEKLAPPFSVALWFVPALPLLHLPLAAWINLCQYHAGLTLSTLFFSPGTYFTHEAKGADDAADADTAIINAEGGHSNSDEKKEYYIWSTSNHCCVLHGTCSLFIGGKNGKTNGVIDGGIWAASGSLLASRVDPDIGFERQAWF